MLFLQDQETPSDSISTMDSDIENDEEINHSTVDVSILLLYYHYLHFLSIHINYSYNKFVLPWYFSFVIKVLTISISYIIS